MDREYLRRTGVELMSDRVIVGAFGGAFSVQGEVRLKSYCADPHAIADYAPLFTEDGRSFAQVVLSHRAVRRRRLAAFSDPAGFPILGLTRPEWSPLLS